MSTDLTTDTDERQGAPGSFRGLHSEVTEKVIGVLFEVYNELGGGFLESVYQEAMRIALLQPGLRVATEVPISAYFRGEVSGTFVPMCSSMIVFCWN
jgi:GxxExxY protein